jgi:hypothetical protein
MSFKYGVTKTYPSYVSSFHDLILLPNLPYLNLSFYFPLPWRLTTGYGFAWKMYDKRNNRTCSKSGRRWYVIIMSSMCRRQQSFNFNSFSASGKSKFNHADSLSFFSSAARHWQEGWWSIVGLTHKHSGSYTCFCSSCRSQLQNQSRWGHRGPNVWLMLTSEGSHSGWAEENFHRTRHKLELIQHSSIPIPKICPQFWF